MNINRPLLPLCAALALTLGGASVLSSAFAYESGSTWSSDGGSRSSDSLKFIGLTADQRLISFDDSRPADARSIGYVRGLTGDTALIGIDYRVQNDRLYGVGNAGGVYIVDPSTANASKVSQLTVALNGTSFGVDFNPAADRLRIVSDVGQNLRHNVNAGGVTIADTTLSYSPGVAATGIGGAAYTNNDLDANTSTTLYDIDFNLDQVVLQSPANAGTLAATGKLGVDAGAVVGFDIYSTIRDGSTVNIEGYASLLSPGGATRLYEVTLFNGKARSLGAFASENAPVDIAIPLGQR